MHLLGNPSHFVISLFDFNKSFLGLFVKLTPFLDCGNASIGCKENADWIHMRGLLQVFELVQGAQIDAHRLVDQVLDRTVLLVHGDVA